MVSFNETPLNSTPFGDVTSSSPSDLSGLPLRTKIVYWVISTFGMISNVFVIVVIVLYAPMRKQLTNTFIVNQSAIDAVAAALLSLSTVFSRYGTRFTTGNTGAEILCRL